jgi:hypothetical protein
MSFIIHGEELMISGSELIASGCEALGESLNMLSRLRPVCTAMRTSERSASTPSHRSARGERQMEAGDVRRFERRAVDHSGLTSRVNESAVESFLKRLGRHASFTDLAK